MTDKTRDLKNGIFLIPLLFRFYYVCAVEDIGEQRKKRKMEGRKIIGRYLKIYATTVINMC